MPEIFSEPIGNLPEADILSVVTMAGAQRIATVIGNRWRVETELHWTLVACCV